MPGVLPRAGRLIARGAVWCMRHPQPFLLALMLAGGGVGIVRIATQSELFRVTQIERPAEVELSVPDSLIGQNLWAIDLAALAQELRSQDARLTQVRVIRRLPNTLVIDAQSRLPVAQVKLTQWHAVDAEGFVFPDSRAKPFDELVRLEGLIGSSQRLRVGQANTDEHLRLALRLMAQLQRAPVFAEHRLTAIDVGNPNQLIVTIDDGIEVRCGNEAELPAQLARLDEVLERVTKHDLAVRYIDVRFAEPVVGPKT